jgi:hypothetical protein
VDPDISTVVQCELALLLPEVRSDPQRVRALLHPHFVESGASGRVWDRDSVVAATVGSGDEITSSDLVARRVGPDVVLLTYRSRHQGRESLRSSTWIREEPGAWLLLFHQGTPVGGS